MSKPLNTVNRKALLIVSVIFLLSIILIVSSIWFKGTMRQVYNLIDHANEVEIALRDILFKVKDSEADLRAYVITNKDSYLDNFSANKVYVRQKTENLAEFVNDSIQIANCAELSNLLKQRFAILEGLAGFSDTLDLPEFQRIIQQGETVSERIEGHIASMVSYEKEVLVEHERHLFSLMETRRRVSILGGLFAMALAAIIFILIREESALIKRRQELLQELNDNKDKFFSIISHDLKNPFTAIKGFIEMLNHEEYRRSTEDLDEITRRLKSSADRFDRLLSDLLTWARLQINAVEVKQEKVDINQILSQVSSHYNPFLENKNLQLRINAPLSLYALADKTMTETILRNLVGNAIKFTESGNISLSTYGLNGQVIIDVTDTGTGIEPDILKNLFKLGKIKSTKGTRSETGTGMGLILCKDMAERQGGKLEVKSVYGKGTTITLFLRKTDAVF